MRKIHALYAAIPMLALMSTAYATAETTTLQPQISLFSGAMNHCAYRGIAEEIVNAAREKGEVSAYALFKGYAAVGYCTED